MNEEISNRVAFCLRDIKHIVNEHTKIMKRHINSLTSLSDGEKEELIDEAAKQYGEYMLEE